MKTQLKVNRISATMLDKLSEVCEWELDGDHIIEDGDEFSAIHTELMHRVVSRMYQDLNLGQKKYKKNTTQAG